MHITPTTGQASTVLAHARDTRPVNRARRRWPVYRINATGSVRELAFLRAVDGSRYLVTGVTRKQTLLERMHGRFEGIPYYLQDAWPAGFVGRAVPLIYPGTGLPVRVMDWSDDHFLTYLTTCAADSVSDLIVGEEALQRYLSAMSAPPVVAAAERARTYPELADASMAGRPPPSSAHGEHPKFIVTVASGEQRAEMLVKFSPPRASDAGRRWADLLVAEHHAHRILARHGVPACDSRVFLFGERTYLEVRRFDRVGSDGRKGAVSLFAMDAARYGRLDSWDACAQRLGTDGLLSAIDVEQIRLLDVFGALIANNDRHFGNITLFDEYEGPLRLAPTYDMLPMLFAPRNGQLVQPEFEPRRPTSAPASITTHALAIAEEYWKGLREECMLSAEFRRVSDGCLARLRSLTKRGVSNRRSADFLQ